MRNKLRIALKQIYLEDLKCLGTKRTLKRSIKQLVTIRKS